MGRGGYDRFHLGDVMLLFLTLLCYVLPIAIVITSVFCRTSHTDHQGWAVGGFPPTKKVR